MIKTKLNVLRCTRLWLWLERRLGVEPLRTALLSPVERANYDSYGESKRSPGCRCRPTNVLYWELSEANPTGCPVHQPPGGSDG